MTRGLRFDLRQRQEDFSLTLCVQTGCGAHPVSFPLGTWDKAQLGRDADHYASSAKIKNE
jgi:hypothetical protein